MRTTAKVLFAAFAVWLLAMPAWAQDSASPGTAINGFESNTHQSFVGLATDWSSHHLVYSKPAAGSDTEDRVQQNPRYWEQQIRRSLPDSEAALVSDVQTDDFTADKKKKNNANNKRNRNKTTLTGLWEVNMDSAATSGAEMFPATFTATTTASCANATQPDFVVYNTNVAGGTPATATATNAGTFGNGNNTPSGTFTITNSFTGVSLVLTAAANNTGNNFLIGNNSGTGSATNAASLAARIAALGTSVGVTATSSGSNVTVTALNAGTDGNSITLATTLNRFTLNLTELAGGTNAATIMAFDNLYTTTCNSFGTIPAAYWSYNTGGTEHTSPVVSQAGNEVAFVQSVGTAASLVVLKFAPGNGHLGAAQLTTSSPTYPTCTAPCMISIPFSGGADDTNSAPFVDQGTLYVGDNAGKLHKFINIFNGGIPAEAPSPWPVTVSTHALSSPVADLNTFRIFVGDGPTGAGGGIAREVRDVGSTGTCGTPPCVDATLQIGAVNSNIVDGPLVDVSTGKVLWFAALIKGASSTLTDYVTQTDESLGTAVTLTFANGSGTARTGNMHAGTFDNLYFNQAPGSGFLYFCAEDAAGGSNQPGLWRVGFTTAGVMNSATDTAGGVPLNLVNASGNQECSPVTEIFNGTTDREFVSVTADGALTGCTGACLYSFAPASRTVTDGHTTNASTTVTSASAAFVAGDVGSAITGTNIPVGTTITNRTNGTTITISHAATGTTTTATLNIVDFPTTSSDGLASPGGTSGLSIDNVFSTTGASNIYFTPLTPPEACITVGGSGGCATQASQSALN